MEQCFLRATYTLVFPKGGIEILIFVPGSIILNPNLCFLLFL